MNKAKLAGAILLLLSLVVVAVATLHLLRQKHRQMLCVGHLQHWGTALHIYLQQQEERGRQPANTEAEWYSLLRGYLYALDAAECPAASPLAGQFSYKLNPAAIPSPGVRLALANRPGTVFLFDGKQDVQPLAAGPQPYKQVANRHLGGANLLLLNGAVVYVAARQDGLATMDDGWLAPGNQRWK